MIFCGSAWGQSYFQQRVDHQIEVRLDDKTHTLHAFETIEYFNNSPQTLTEIYMHLWPNAYATTFSELGRQKIEDGDVDLHFSTQQQRGGIDSLHFIIDGTPVPFTDYEGHKDIAYIQLPSPLPPGEKITITTPFRVKIPDAAFSRLGHVEESYMITQWFPKPAVYDADGWHPMPYLSQGEFYSEFGSYDVRITLPKNYVVGATGDLQTSSERAFLEERNHQTRAAINKKSLVRYNKAGFPDTRFPKSDTGFKTLHYVQQNIHDFAWFADKRFHVLKSEVTLPHAKRKVTTWAMFTNNEADLWTQAPSYLDSAIYYYSLWNGDYPYNQVTAVDGTIAAGGGMEYPNVTVIGNSINAHTLETVIVHEVGHNWFYGILGSNERDHPWMDEGLNSLNENRYMETRYPKATIGASVGLPKPLQNRFGLGEYPSRTLNDFSYLLNARRNLDQPIELKSRAYTPTNYGAIVYSKTSIVFDYLKAYLGNAVFDSCMHAYYDRWQFKHPGPNDLRNVFEECLNEELQWFFDDLIGTTKKIDYTILKTKWNEDTLNVSLRNKGDVASPVQVAVMKDEKILATTWTKGFKAEKTIQFTNIDPKAYTHLRIDPNLRIPEIDRTNNTYRNSGLLKRSLPTKFRFIGGLESNQYNYINWLPLIGWNTYNGFMLGASFYNHTFPERKLEYTLNPLFSFKTGTPTGMGDIHRNFYPKNAFRKITWGVRYQTFHFRAEKESKGRFQATSPYLELELKKKQLRSNWKHHFRLDYHYIDNYAKGADPLFSNPEKRPLRVWEQIHAGRLQYTFSNRQVLKPFRLVLHLESGVWNDHFLSNNFRPYSKASLTANWRINYNINLDGVDLRFFVGKFFRNETLSSKFNWNLSGQNGRTDYLYEHIFLGRLQNHPDFLSQQMTETQGAFKARTRLGASNDWLIAGNIKIDFPIHFLKAYADAGAYPIFNVSTQQSEISFLSNIGLNISIGKGVADLYIPLFLSEDILSEHDFQGIDFWQRIRFTLNLSELNPFKMIQSIRL